MKKHKGGHSYLLTFVRDSGDLIGGIILGAQIAKDIPSIGAFSIAIILIAASLSMERWYKDCEESKQVKDFPNEYPGNREGDTMNTVITEI